VRHGSPTTPHLSLAEDLVALRRQPSNRGLWRCLAAVGDSVELTPCPADPDGGATCRVCVAELGAGDTVRHLAAFLNRAAHSALPVLIVGEPGTGREDAARALHLLDRSRSGPLAVLDAVAGWGPDLEARLDGEWARGRAGTLLLDSADRLPRELQSRLGSWLRYATPDGARAATRPATRHAREAPRLMVTTASAALHPRLLREVDFLRLEIEPLRRRRGDIRHLAALYARLYGDGHRLSDEVMAALTSYPWPGNRDELRRVVARLAALVLGDRARLSDLRTLSPELQAAVVHDGSPPADPAALARLLADGAATGRGGDPPADVPAGFPAAVSRGLRYLQQHYRDAVRLADLAPACCASPSHLSHLFRRHVGTSPIALLNMLRVEHAKRLLASDPERSVTRVADDVGFGDLRHFERIFKRHAGRTPQQFRQG